MMSARLMSARRGLPSCVLLSTALSALACGAADPAADGPAPGNVQGNPQQPGAQPPAGAAGVANSPLGMGAGGSGSSNEAPTSNVGLPNPPPVASGGAGSTPATPPMMTAGAGGAPTVTPPANVTELFVSETGSDVNPGTREQPFATLTRANTFARPGMTIFVLPGTLRYATTMLMSADGTQGQPINVFAADGARPIVDFSGQPRGESSSRGIELRGSFWHVKGLEVRNAGDNGILISGSNNVVENVILHGNGDTGLQILAPEVQATDPSRASNNLVLNCDSFENFDPANNGENADGFAAKLRVGPGNVFRGCRAWNNADDGWDFFAADDVVTIEDSWAFLNGIIAGGGNSAGDGNGFKLGGEPDGVGQGHSPHVVINGAAFANRACGFTLNNNTEDAELSQCGVGANETDFCDGASCTGEFDVRVTGAQAINLPRNADGSLPSIR